MAEYKIGDVLYYNLEQWELIDIITEQNYFDLDTFYILENCETLEHIKVIKSDIE